MKPPSHPLALALLGLPAALYGAIVGARNRHYDKPGAAKQVALPVISVGNLTAGGTGKTPIVAWLARGLLDRGRRPAIVSRGYGGTAGKGPLFVSDGSGPRLDAGRCGDEPHLLARTLPGVTVIVGSDRCAGAEAAHTHGCDVVLLDDGFQHRRLHRDLDLLLLDAGAPFDNGRLLPAGLLREAVSGLARADAILITRTRPGEDHPEIESEIRRHNPTAPISLAGHEPVGFVDLEGTIVKRPSRALAFSGIGNPESFRSDLHGQGIELVDFRAFADHHPYTAEELRELQDDATEAGATLVTTEKDLARIEWRDDGGTTPVALRIEARIWSPDALWKMVDRTLR